MTTERLSVGARWYAVPGSDEPLAQGDQLWAVQLLEPYVTGDAVARARLIELDLVVLTQSCDLEHGKVDAVLIAPVHNVADWIEENPADLTRLEDIRQGYDSSLYLLPAWSEAPQPGARVDRVIDFVQLRTVPHEVLDVACRRDTLRLALRSPAREHLAQAVARAFMRVGLPIDVPSFRLDRPKREDRLLDVSPEVEVALGQFGLALARPIPVTLHQRLRPSTGDVYFLLSTRGLDPAVAGAGCDVTQAGRSLLRQLGRRWVELLGGDERLSWLRQFLAPAEPIDAGG
jgi:hypothetical protein